MSGSNWTPTKTALAALAGLVALAAIRIIQNAAATVAAFERSQH
jgi:MYXO-CTERM domain-containing protein